MQRISKLYLSLSSRSNAGLAEMPDARGMPFLGAVGSLVHSQGGQFIHEYIDSLHRKHGPIFRGTMGPSEAVFISSSDIIREVFRLEGPMPRHFVPDAWLQYNRITKRKRGLLFMDDDEWLKHRRILNKVMLSPQSVDLMIEPCHQAAKDLVKTCKTVTDKDGIVPNLELLLYQWSIEVVLATFAGPVWPAYRDLIATELGTLSANLRLMLGHTVRLSWLPASWAASLRLPAWRGFVGAADHALASCERYVNELIRLTGTTGTTAASATRAGNEPGGLMGQMLDQGMGIEAMRRIISDFVIAGDTTSYAMQWLLLLLAGDPEIQDRINDELTILSTDGGGGDAEERIIRNALLKGAIRESMRLYPTAAFVTRFLPQDAQLAGYPVAKGELLVSSLFSSGRDEASFPRATEFRPERWSRNERGEYEGVNNPSATLPFAMGVRSCVGRKLVECQMSLAIAELLKHFKIDCLNKHEVKMKMRMISQPSKPLILQLIPRSS